MSVAVLSDTKNSVHLQFTNDDDLLDTSMINGVRRSLISLIPVAGLDVESEEIQNVKCLSLKILVFED